MDDAEQRLRQALSRLGAERARPNESRRAVTYDSPNSLAVLTAVGANGSSTPVFVKVYRRSSKMFDGQRTFDMHRVPPEVRIEREFASLERFYAGLQGQACYRVPRPVACFPDLLALVTEQARGTSLQNLIGRHARLFPSRRTVARLERYCHACGTWLRVFHQLTRQQGESLEPRSMIPYVDTRMKRLVGLRQTGFDESLRQQILGYFQRQVACIAREDLAVVAVHGDFSPANILVDDDGGVTVLDFAMVDHGSPCHDICYLYQRLRFFCNKPIYRAGIIASLQRATLAGYGTYTVDRPLFRLLQIQHILTNFVSVSRREEMHLPLHKRLFDRWIYRRYIRLLRELMDTA